MRALIHSGFLVGIARVIGSVPQVAQSTTVHAAAMTVVLSLAKNVFDDC